MDPFGHGFKRGRSLLPISCGNYQSSKNNKINWTPKLEEIYEDVKQKVANCPKLFFINEQDPIFLSTDASNIGIGAYLERDSRVSAMERPALQLLNLITLHNK